MWSIPKHYKKYRTEFHRYGLLLAAPLVLGIVLFFCVRAVTVGQMEQVGEYEVSRFAAHAHNIVMIFRELGLDDFLCVRKRLGGQISLSASLQEQY